ncbi:MAG: hypothetical protein EOO41_00650, partial [Methanobacteriota archaeon]
VSAMDAATTTAADTSEYNLFGTPALTVAAHLMSTATDAADARACSVTPALYNVFWGHASGDLYCPATQYETAMQTLRDIVQGLSKVAESDVRNRTRTRYAPHPPQLTTRTVWSHRFATAARAHVAPRYFDALCTCRLLSTLKGLATERATQDKHLQRVRSRIVLLRDALCVSASTSVAPNVCEKSALADAPPAAAAAMTFVRVCLLPRILLSPADAVYAAQFLQFMVDLEVPNFGIMHVLQASVFAIITSLPALTEREVAHAATYLKHMMAMVHTWLKYVWACCAEALAAKRRTPTMFTPTLSNVLVCGAARVMQR